MRNHMEYYINIFMFTFVLEHRSSFYTKVHICTSSFRNFLNENNFYSELYLTYYQHWERLINKYGIYI